MVPTQQPAGGVSSHSGSPANHRGSSCRSGGNTCLTSPHADLVLGIEGRGFICADGRHNFPDGEIFTGPEESGTEGWVRFTYPALYSGREGDGVELGFEGGKV